MIHTDGKRTIANAVARMEDLPVELLSGPERRERALTEIVDQVSGYSCPFCGSEAAEFSNGGTLLGCPDCGYDMADPAEVAQEAAEVWSQTTGVEERVERSVAQEQCTFCPEDIVPMNDQQRAFDERESVHVRADRWRMENPSLRHLDIDLLHTHDIGTP